MGSNILRPIHRWTGGRDPIVELTFETETQRIWRCPKGVRKEWLVLVAGINKTVATSMMLNVRERLTETARDPEGGIPEPGGSGGTKGVPTSFLATALLSTQADVTALLHESLQKRSKVLTVRSNSLQHWRRLRKTPCSSNCSRARRLAVTKHTPTRARRKPPKDSVFKVAAERVKETREEKERPSANRYRLRGSRENVARPNRKATPTAGGSDNRGRASGSS